MIKLLAEVPMELLWTSAMFGYLIGVAHGLIILNRSERERDDDSDTDTATKAGHGQGGSGGDSPTSWGD